MTIYDNGKYREMTPEEVALFESAAIVSAEEEIEMLREELTKDDYKIIKSFEYFLAGKEPPYNVTELHAKRQLLRDKINGLEENK